MLVDRFFACHRIIESRSSVLPFQRNQTSRVAASVKIVLETFIDVDFGKGRAQLTIDADMPGIQVGWGSLPSALIPLSTRRKLDRDNPCQE